MVDRNIGLSSSSIDAVEFGMAGDVDEVECGDDDVGDDTSFLSRTSTPSWIISSRIGAGSVHWYHTNTKEKENAKDKQNTLDFSKFAGIFFFFLENGKFASGK